MTTPQHSAGELVRAYREALQPFFAHYARAARQMHAALQPVLEQMRQHPELLDQARREPAPEGCHCLCGVHREQGEGICRGEAQPGLTFTFDSPTTGRQSVPMCRPCHGAHVERAADIALRRTADPLAFSPDAMSVTFPR